MADLDELALALPQTTKEVSDDGRPSYRVHGKLFCCQRGRRADALDPETGERLDDVLMFRVADLDMKDLLLGDDRGTYFTTPHFDGYPAVLVRIAQLARLDRDELGDLVAEALADASAEARRQGVAGRALGGLGRRGVGRPSPPLCTRLQPVVYDQMSVSPKPGGQAPIGFGGLPASSSVRRAMRQSLIGPQTSPARASFQTPTPYALVASA
jgi:hypothetical protein